MISIKTFLKGFFLLNAFLSPIHVFLIIIALNARPEVYAFYEQILRVFLVISLTIGTQLISLIALILLAKIYDFLRSKNKFRCKNISYNGIIFSAVLNSIILSIYFNLLVDNLFQLTQGNYSIILAPSLGLMFYYYVCYQIGSKK